jgi:hypothetical protein
MDLSATASTHRASAVLLLAASLAAPAFAAQLNDKCVVSVLNRTSYVQADGSWVLPNVPSNLGRVRVRATCVENGVTTSGQSEFFDVPRNGIIKVPEIVFDAPRQVPSKLVLTASQTTLGAVGATAQLTLVATYPDLSTADVTGPVTGTNYTSSNPAIASVTSEGLVTAHASGTIIVMGLNDGATALLRLSVVLSGDTDGDGIPDDIELANGLNPNDPVDALEDYDGDGLTNRQELELGTQIRNADTDGDTLPDGREVDLGTEPLVFDTDGDGLSDGLEVSTGSDPLDPNSYNLAQALSFIEVSPAATVLVVNTLIGEASRQLTVTGRLIDGTSLNLTSTTRGTNYASSNLSIVSFGLVDGQIFAGANGAATVTVSNAGFSAVVNVTVRSFAPTALSFVSIPGYANNVDVAGGYAYVAAGSAGLQVVDVGDKLHPVIVGALDTPGVAIDVRVSGNYAYVADGTVGGLRIIDISNPTAPVAVGSLDTPGDAQDVVLRGTLAYVADGNSGLRIIDVSVPSAPVSVGFLDTAGTARGVDVTGDLAVVADGVTSLRVIDVSNPAAPVLRGSVAVPGDVKDVTARGRYAYVSAYTGSLQVVDVNNPAAPVVVGSTPGFVPRDFELFGRFGLAAEQLFPNAVPVVDTTNPVNPGFPLVINFSGLGDYAGTGIAVDASHLYMTAEFFVVSVDYGVTGNTRLFVGQYLEISDDFGIPPVVEFTSPPPDAEPIAGTTLTLRATATDDVGVAAVRFAVDGVPVGTDFTSPYEVTITLPAQAGPLTLSASAQDFGDNIGTATRTINVRPDPLPVVTLTQPAPGATVMEATTITLAATATDNGSVTRVRFVVNGAQVAIDTTAPYAVTYAVPLGATSLEIVAEATDNLGQIGSVTLVQPVTPDPAPVVEITSPAAGATPMEGAPLTLSATATDNISVSDVRFLVDGTLVATDTSAPYSTRVTVPLGVTSLTVAAQATDNLGRSTTVTRTLTVLPDPKTTVTGTVQDQGGQPVSAADVRVFGEFATQTAADGSFSLANVPTARGPITVVAEALVGGRRHVGTSQPTEPVPGGTTDVGTITLKALSFEIALGELVPEEDFGNLDDGSALVALPFTFDFYGVAYDEVWVGTNGYLTFGQSDNTCCTDVTGILQNAPRIAPKFRDWFTQQDPDGAGIWVNTSLPDRVVITWKNMIPFGGGGEAIVAGAPGKATSPVSALVGPPAPQPTLLLAGAAAASTPDQPCDHPQSETACSPAPPDAPGAPVALPTVTLPSATPAAAATPAPDAGLPGELPTSTFQVVLHADGRIQIGYDGAFLRDAIVGMTPGGDGGGAPEAGGLPANQQPYDFSAQPPIAVDSNTAPYEAFFGFGDNPFDLDHSFLGFDPDGQGGYTGVVQVPEPQAPTVSIITPAVGDLLIEGQVIDVLADANDDVLVSQVAFTIDGNVYEPLIAPPYEVGYELPLGATSVTIQVTATDNQGQTTTTSATFPVSPDPAPTVALAQPSPGTTLIEGETVTIGADADDNVAVTRVDLSVQTLALPADVTAPYARTFRVPAGVASLSVTATATDNLDQSTSATAVYSIAADPRTTVHGTVVDVNGTPVAGASVELALKGLKAEFFALDGPQAGIPDLTGLTPASTRLVSSLDFRNPGNLFNSDTFGSGLAGNFAARFSATLSVEAGGFHTFILGANDGAQLRLDGTTRAEVVSGTYAETSALINLTAGTHTLEVIYFQNDGDAELQLSWVPPGQDRDAIPGGVYRQASVAFSATSDASGEFSFADVPTMLGGVRARASATIAGQPRQGQSGEVLPVRGGTTELGNVQLLPPVRAVGYYDLDLNSGRSTQAAPITTAGLQAVNIGSLATADLSAVQMLFVQNPNNGGYSTNYRNNLAKVWNFVSDGGVLIFHDRHVDTAETILPGAPGNILRDFADDRNVQIVNAGTSVTNGPGGVLNDTSLDGGNSSTHGYIQAASIPAGALGVLSRGNASELVLYAYRHGLGWVVYSTIPLDFYLGGSGPSPVSGNLRLIYSPNVIQFGRDLKEGRIGGGN